MEGYIDIWEGFTVGWKTYWMTIFENMLYISENRGGQVKLKLPIGELKIPTMNERDSKFTIEKAGGKWEFNAKDSTEKSRWITAIVNAQQAIRGAQDRNDVSSRIVNMGQITSEKDIQTYVNLTGAFQQSMKERLSNCWLLQARLTEGLANLSLKIPQELRQSADLESVASIGNDLKKELVLLMKDFELESKKITEIDKVLKNKAGGSQTEAYDYNEVNVEHNEHIIPNEGTDLHGVPTSSVNIAHDDFSQLSRAKAHQPGYNRSINQATGTTNLPYNAINMAREIEEANAADEEEFASAKGSLRGESNYYSVIEYDNLSMLMDGRTTPMTLKKKQEEAMAQAQFNFQKKASGSSRQLAHQVPKNQPASKATPVNTSGFHTNSGKIGTPQNAFASSPTRANLSPIVKAVSPHEVIHTPLPLKYHPLVEEFLNNRVFVKYPVNTNEKTRTQLPHLIDPKKKIDIIKLIKDSIGQDLTRIAFPAYMNEPQSMLQRLVEGFEYKECLDKAAATTDSALRLAYCMAYLFIAYANTPLRMKKPFNPLLGETFDFNIGGLDVVCEQVSHHPPISACHGRCKEYQVYASTNVESSLGLRSFNINPKGGFHVYFSNNDHIWVKQCKSYVYNLILGTMDIQHHGEMTGKNFKTGDTVTLNLNDCGTFAKHPSQANGKVIDRDGKLRYTLKGDWKNDPCLIATPPNGPDIELVRKKPNPDNFIQNYRFTNFAINANHVWKDLLYEICPTDCRLRPDTRALEYGDEDMAEAEKKRLEQKQREKRKERESKREHWDPKWFRAEYDIDSSEQVYKYKGNYWESRKKRDWPNIESLY